MTWFTWAWIALFLVGFSVEGVALVNKVRRDTLSEQVWFLRAKRWGRAVLMPFWAWLTWHFWVEPASMGPLESVWWDDWTLVGFFFAVAVTFNLYGKKADNE